MTDFSRETWTRPDQYHIAHPAGYKVSRGTDQDGNRVFLAWQPRAKENLSPIGAVQTLGVFKSAKAAMNACEKHHKGDTP
jgi:hypothetical protein